MTHIPNPDLDEGYLELSPNAFKLMTYIYSKGDGWNFVDENIAKAFNLTNVRTVRKLFRELELKGYLYRPKGEVETYFIGKKKVEEYKPD